MRPTLAQVRANLYDFMSVNGGDLSQADEESRLKAVTDGLIRRFDHGASPIPAQEIEAQVNQAASAYADARIRDFVPVLAEKDARTILDQRVLAAE